MLNRGAIPKLINLGPIFLLYYFSISEVDTHFENYFDILSFNVQLIIIYFWALKSPTSLDNGHIFFAGLINDVVLGYPLGLSSLTFLTISLIAAYIKNMTVHTTLVSDWFTFFIALLLSNLIFYLLMSNFSEISINITEISYNTFFTFIFFPFFWLLFNYYYSLMRVGKNA